ncbi:MAG: hypothetical protein ACXWPS_08240 [Ktedonobacteraceae bacterium]
MNASQILAAIMPVIEALEELGASYHIGGSVARCHNESCVKECRKQADFAES